MKLKLGFALIELFENYEEIFIGTDNNKFNKNIILLIVTGNDQSIDIPRRLEPL